MVTAVDSPPPGLASCDVATAAAAVVAWTALCGVEAPPPKVMEAEGMFLAAEKFEDLCSTAVPSPSLIAERYVDAADFSASWESQELDAFVLSDAALTMNDWASDRPGPSSASSSLVASAEEMLEPPPGLDMFPATTEEQYEFYAEAEAQAMAMQMGCSIEDFMTVSAEAAAAAAAEDSEWRSWGEGAAAVEAATSQLPRHAETGDWAWRIAPRPDFDGWEPLAVRPGMAPDGGALLEAAIGLSGVEINGLDCEGFDALGDAKKAMDRRL